MKRIAVISDSHGGKVHLERFAQICEKEQYDEIFHLGDVTEDVGWLEQRLGRSVASVAGNCDPFSTHAREAFVKVDGKRILLTHGDKHGVKFGYERLSYYAEEHMAVAALFGHTHRPFCGMLGSVLLVNPGALKNGSMCVLEFENGDIAPRFIDVDDYYAEVVK